jgi:hypothetical protein
MNDETFRSSLERPIDSIRGSIRSVGLLFPVRVQRRSDLFRVVSGFLRSEVLISEEMEELAIEAYDERIPKEALLAETLHENRFTRGFSWAERGWVLHRVSREWGKPRSWVMEQVMPALDLQPAPRVLEDHLRVHALSEPVRRVLLRSGCSMANALRVCGWALHDQEALIPLFEQLHLGENILREVLEKIKEVTLREGVSVASFLESAKCREILEDPERDCPSKTRAFRSYLRSRRYPTLFSMEEAFRKARANLGLPPKLSIDPAPFFEEAGVKVSFRAHTPEEFREFSGKLRDISNREGKLEALFLADDDTAA